MDTSILPPPWTQEGSDEGSSQTRAPQTAAALRPWGLSRQGMTPLQTTLGALLAGCLSSLFSRTGKPIGLRVLGRCGGGAAAGSEGCRKGCECGGGLRAAPPRGGSPGRCILAPASEAAAATAVGEGPGADMTSRGSRPGPNSRRPAQ